MEQKDCIEQLKRWMPLCLQQSRFKSMLYNFLKVDLNKLQEEIEKVTCVSFDVFDTLVKRDVASPIDVFTLMEKKLENESDSSCAIPCFSRMRITAEQRARAAASDREVTLSEIYEYLPLKDSQRNNLMELECQMELELSTVNLEIKSLYDLCLKKGKKIVFISDMYLPTEEIEKILRKNGYEEGRLYVSSKSGLTKHSGRLFQYVREKENINYNTWLHIGDSLCSDYLTPRGIGIRAYLINRYLLRNSYVNKKLYRENPMYQQLEHFIDTRISRYTDPYERIGYAVLGPLLYGFSLWLEKEIPPNETIVFLAREGALLKQAFELVSSRSSVYLRVSRHALNCVRLDQAESVDEILNAGIDAIKPHSKLKVWAKMYGLSDDDIDTVFQSKGLNKEAVVKDEVLKKHFLTAIWPVIKSSVRGQYELFSTYLRQFNISGNCAVVDVGWAGTMQAFLTSICEDDHQVNMKPIRWKGYYMGISRMGCLPPYDKFEKRAFLFDGVKNKHIRDSVEYSHDFFEMLTLSTDGTTQRYERTSDGIRPVLAKSDNYGKSIHKILLLQKAGLDFVQDVTKSPACMGNITAQVASANYESLARVPTLATLRLFQGFNIFDEKELALVEGEPIWRGIFHLRQLLYDFSCAGNKAWFLKNVFRLPYPYISVINIAKRIAGKERKLRRV